VVSNPLYAHREFAANKQRFEAVIEAAKPDEAIPLAVGVEERQVPPGLEVAKIARLFVAERPAAVFSELARKVDDLLVRP